MSTYTTRAGTVYRVDEASRTAYPLWGPVNVVNKTPMKFPTALWDIDVAAGCGQLVDATLDRGDYRVRAAGPDWREVYEYLRGRAE